MGSHVVSTHFVCADYCRPPECPGHTMRAIYNRTVDTLHVTVDTPEDTWLDFWLDIEGMQALRNLFEALGGPVSYIGSYEPSTDQVQYER